MESDLSFLARMWDFLSALGTAWFALVTGVVLVIEQLFEAVAPKLFRAVDRRWPKEARQRSIRWLIAASLLYTAFQAYDEINEKLQKTQAQLASAQEKLASTQKRAARVSASTSRLAVSGLTFQGTMDGSDVPLKVKVANQGSIPAGLKLAIFQGSFGKNDYSQSATIMSDMEKQATFWIKRAALTTEVRPGDSLTFDIASLSDPGKLFYAKNDAINEFMNSKNNINLYGYLIYSDDALEGNTLRVTKFCASYTSLNEWISCPGLNGTASIEVAD